MKILDINKAVYRTRLNRVIIGFIVGLALLSLGFGSMLISLFTDNTAVLSEIAGENGQTNNFKYNFLGVLLALLACASILHRLKTTEFFHEVYYVWQLKQIHNQIYRKLKRIKKAAFADDDVNAMIILNYYYSSQKQVYLLDDNTLTMSVLNKVQQKLNALLASKNITVEIEQFDIKTLASY
mgnify:CR=1 FL=1